MKRFFIIIYSSLFAFVTYAQIPDWILDMASDDTVIVAKPMAKVKNVYNENLILDAVIPSLSIVRQQYQLKFKDDVFGREDKLYYGETYTLGIKISNNILLQRDALFPWEHDSDYKRVNPGDKDHQKYQPVYYRSYQRSIRGTEWKEVDFDFDNFTKAKDADSLLFQSQDKISDFGLPTDETIGEKHGYMIWLYSSTNLQDSAMQVEVRQKELTIEVKGTLLPTEIPSDIIQNTLGGIFVVPQIERIGYIKVLLAGVVTKDSQNRWVLKMLASKQDDVNANDPMIIKKVRKTKINSKES